jgi:F0F1-type ATP synthase membrane subunit b/b'
VITIEILQLLKQLEELVENTRYIALLRLTYGLNHDEFFVLVNRIRASLPEDVKRASNVTRERDRILETAREEAKHILEEGRVEAARLLEDARLQAQRMVDQSEIVMMAKEQARQIVASAQEDARQVRRGADEYARDVLNNLEAVLSKAIGTIQRGKEALDESLREEERVPAATGRG